MKSPTMYTMLFYIAGAFLFFFDAEYSVAKNLIRVYDRGPLTGHYLSWNGRPILLIGDSVTQGWMELGHNFDQREYIDNLAESGINLLMLWSYIGTNASRQKKDFRIGYDSPEIWPWKGSPDSRTFNLNIHNYCYFDRLENLVAYAEKKNIVVLITLHDGWTKDRFPMHPFNARLGNGPLLRNDQYVELADYDREMPNTFQANWNRKQKNQYYQERFCEKIISTLKPFSNVIYEMFNEGEWYNKKERRLHEQHFLKFFRARCQNLLVTNSDHIDGDDAQGDEKVDIISMHGNWTDRFPEFYKNFNKKPPKPYLLSEPVPSWNGTNIKFTTIRRSMWEVALAGAGWVNQNDLSFAWDTQAKINSKAYRLPEAYKYAGNCAKFFSLLGTRLVNMKPSTELSSTGIAMASKGMEYIVYSPFGEKFTVDLRNTNSDLSAEWYNDESGEFRGIGAVHGGGKVIFETLNKNEKIIHIGPKFLMLHQEK